MSQVRQKTKRVGEIAAKAVVQLLLLDGEKFHSDGVREKLREFFGEEVSGGNASGGGVKQFGTHHRTAFLQSSARLSCLMKSETCPRRSICAGRES
jgi:hypothetical protein